MMLQLKFFIVAVVLVRASHMKMLNVRNNFDPGSCAKSNHGELILVKDRENKDTMLVCTEHEGVYTWKTTDGLKPPGEYFNPGYDCMDILNLNKGAKDGYYWVDFHRSVPYKVWCDMTTDGGGYMLIGRMNDSVTWDVPSTNNPVEPFGFPQWSSAFGDVPILDFRIQVATDRLYKQVIAHWSFRFKNKRPLKRLLMTNEGGCPPNLPGIGDISFVKNLMTEEIASKNFPCSTFGAYNHPSAKIGWTMMNSCLEKPCSFGFAYHHLFPVQVYFFGGFSFLAGNAGSTDESTAFFGCDKGKCCACYGPPGGSGVYCGKECDSKNDGKVTKNANAWFWVRLNPPQKVWEKCMEYRTEEENGNAAWYKLVGDRNVPVKGRCGKTEAILNDGTIVVPDDISADKLPKISGLLAYQKDSEVLSLRKNNTWVVIAEQETVDYLKLQLQNRISGLERQDISTSSQIYEQQRKISKLERQGTSTNSQISQQQRKISELERQDTSTNSQISQQQRKIRELERQDNSIDSQVKLLQRKVSELERQDSSINYQVSRQQRKINELERQGTSTNSQVSQQQRKINELERKDISINSQITQQQRKISELERKDTSLNSRITQQQNKISQLERQDSSINSQISQLESRFTQLAETNRVRLRGTGYKNKGRVEVYHSSHGWGTVCDDDWDISDGQVVCRQLGFSRATAVYQSAHYGQGTGKTLLDNLGCNGSEMHIWDCSHRGWNVENCSHGEDASVDCA